MLTVWRQKCVCLRNPHGNLADFLAVILANSCSHCFRGLLDLQSLLMDLWRFTVQVEIIKISSSLRQWFKNVVLKPTLSKHEIWSESPKHAYQLLTALTFERYKRSLSTYRYKHPYLKAGDYVCRWIHTFAIFIHICITFYSHI